MDADNRIGATPDLEPDFAKLGGLADLQSIEKKRSDRAWLKLNVITPTAAQPSLHLRNDQHRI